MTSSNVTLARPTRDTSESSGVTQSGRVRKFFVPFLISGAIASGSLGTASAVTPRQSDISAVRETFRETRVAVTQVPGSGQATSRNAGKQARGAIALSIQQLKDQSGLTWAEIAKAMGVSARAVHHWANGATISAANAERLQGLTRIVASAQGMTPRETRSRLLAPGRDGRSKLSSFSDLNSPRRTRPLSDYSVADFVRADEPTHEPMIQTAPTRRSSIKARAAGARKVSRG